MAWNRAVFLSCVASSVRSLGITFTHAGGAVVEGGSAPSVRFLEGVCSSFHSDVACSWAEMVAEITATTTAVGVGDAAAPANGDGAIAFLLPVTAGDGAAILHKYTSTSSRCSLDCSHTISAIAAVIAAVMAHAARPHWLHGRVTSRTGVRAVPAFAAGAVVADVASAGAPCVSRDGASAAVTLLQATHSWFVATRAAAAAHAAFPIAASAALYPHHPTGAMIFAPY